MRFGRRCPGLASGPVIVDMTNNARHGMQKRRKKSVAITKHQEVFIVWPQENINQISQQAMITEAFYARFLSYWTSEGDGKDIRNKTTWLHRLPYYSTDGTNDALTLAVQATASSYCAVETQNPALTRHAWDLYGRAMRTHSQFLARSRTAKYDVTIHMISTTVLFSLFEAMQATSAEAYRSHVYGAAKMFEVTSPNQCAQGTLCQIFFHIRTQMALVQLTSGGKAMPIDIRRILCDALEYEELPLFQRLTNHLTTLADVYNDSIGGGKGVIDVVEYRDVKSAIDTLWQEYTSTAEGPLSWTEASTSSTQYRDAFTALTLSYFSAVRILLGVVAPGPHQTFTPGITDDYTDILQAARYLETCRNGCAYMRMAAPLLLVALHGPEDRQRRIATGCFEGWRTGSMRGISELALETIKSR
jgi:hypothetical protein